MMLTDTTLTEAASLLAALQADGLTLATAESCTGGLIVAALTAIPGSSATCSQAMSLIPTRRRRAWSACRRR